MVFTCTKCDVRSAKSFSRHSYEKGVVIIRCPGCHSNHLIADHFGWFGDKHFTIEDLKQQHGVEIKRVHADQDGELTQGDLIGWSRVQEVLEQLQGSKPSSSSSQQLPSEGSDDSDVIQMSDENLKQWLTVERKAEDKEHS